MKTATPSDIRPSVPTGRAFQSLHSLLSWLKAAPVFALVFFCAALTALNAGAAQAPQVQKREVVFIESNVPDIPTLISGVQPGREVHVLDAAQDGLAQMARILAGQGGVDAIHILSHGAEGSVNLGALTLSAQNLRAHTADLAAIGGALNRDADILLYGCNVAKGTNGAAFISALAQGTHAKIAASNDITGAASLGGNWKLEANTGTVSASALRFSEGYKHVLSVSTLFSGKLLATNTYLRPTTTEYEATVPGPLSTGYNANNVAEGADSYNYFTRDIVTTTGGTYTIEITDTDLISSTTGVTSDTVLLLYTSAFSPSDTPSNGLQKLYWINDEIGGNPYSNKSKLLNIPLTGNTRYTVVATSFSPGVTGRVDFTVTGPARVAVEANTNSSDVVVSSITPTSGTTAGGTSVTITGANFTGASGAAAVTFGGTNATSYSVDSSTQITAVAPAHAAGAVDIVVTATAGTGTGAGLFTYAAPVVNGACGTANGGPALTSAPSGGVLCSAGTATAVDTSGTTAYTWGCNGSGGGNNTGASECTATRKYALSFQSGVNGTLTGTASQAVGYTLSATAVTAVPSANYHFVNWTGTNGFVTTTSNPLTVSNVTAAQTITANFAIDTFAVDFASGGNGTLTGTASQTIDYGSSATAVTAVPAANYHFVNWTGTGSFVTTTSNPLTVSNVTAAQTITANFAIDTFAVGFSSGGNGTLTGTASQTINYGGSATSVTAVPSTGYHFVNWTGTGGFATTTSNPLTVSNVTAAQTITANFAIDTFAVGFVSGGNGTLTGTASQTINYGGNATAVTAVPSANYHFVNWTGTNGFVTTTNNPLTVSSVTAAQTITANFAIDTFAIGFASGGNGTLTGTASQTINYGSNATAVTAVPSANYHFVNWTGTNGFVTTTGNPLTVSNVTAAQTITANFAIDTFALSYSANANGSLTGTASQTVNYGGNGSAVTAVPSSGYYFSSWSDTSTANPRTDSNVTANVTVSATFIANNAPTATPVTVSGTAQIGSQLTGGYTYADTDSTPDVENTSGTTGSSYRWVRADNTGMTTNPASAATGYTLGSTSVNYTVQAADAGKYLFYCVTPRASTGTSPGTEACSANTLQVPTPASVNLVTPPSNGSYRVGQSLSFTLQFTGSVTVNTSGTTPRIALNVGGSPVYATYASGSPGTTLVFTYTVQPSDNDTDGIVATSPIDLNGGTIIDSNSQNATLTWTVPGLTGVKVDTTTPAAPTVVGPANGYYKESGNLDFVATYGETVLVTGIPRIALTIGSDTVYADYLSGSNSAALTFSYTVQSGKNDADGIAAASPIDLNTGGNIGTIKDVAGNDAALTYTVPTLTSVFVDTTVPAVHGSTPIAAANGSNEGNSVTTYDAGDIITLKFTEPVLVANITNGNIAVNNGHTLDIPTIAATDKASYNNTHATTFTLTLGANPTVIVGDTLTIVMANVVDRATNAATANAVFTLPGFNAFPTAGSVAVALPNGVADVAAGVLLTGSYVYNDTDGDTESGTTLQWYTATNSNCIAGLTPIVGATSATYTVLASQEGKYLCFGVTPKAVSGNSPGTEVLAASALFVNAIPVLSNGSVTPSVTGASVSVKINEPAILYWLLAPASSNIPVDAAQIKTIVTEAATTYTCTSESAPTQSGNGFASDCTADVLARGQVNVAAANGTASITLSNLTASTGYILYAVAQDGINNFSLIANANFTTSAVPVVPVTYNTPPPKPDTTILPTGGGTATLTGGQSVTVTENGKDGTSINLPPPITLPPTGTPPTPGAPTTNIVNVTLPGTGTIGVSSDAADTKLGVTKVTLPGATTAVNTVTVDQGSASFTASEKGQAMAGLSNGITIVSGAKDSKVSVDASGANDKIGGLTDNVTLVVPTGSTNVSGTKVDLPSSKEPGGQAATVNLNIGGHELTIKSSQQNTTMTFQVVNVGGVQTPVLSVTGNAQVTTSGEDKPIVSIAGNVIKTGKGKSSGGGSHQVCNTIVQASSDSSSDVVHVVTCYIVLEPGTFSAIGGGAKNSFAAIKDGIVWAGETAEFDKNGQVISAYVGTRSGDTDAVGDDMVPGGGKFAGSGGYTIGAFIPRLNGTPLRLNGARLDESIYAVVKKALGVDMLPSTPSQTAQGVLNFKFTGDLTGQGVQGAAIPQVTYGINSNTASVLPSRRVRVDTSRADGVNISAEGDVDVAVGGLVTTFVASVPDPKAFAEKLNEVLPGATSLQRWNGSWQVKAANGTTYVGRPLWSFWAAAPGAATFSTLADGNILFSDNGISQPLFPDFYDYDTLQGTFRKELNDPNLTVLPSMDGTAVATVNGHTYILHPQWTAFTPPAGKPAWWVEGEVVFIKNADGSAQGFTVN